MLPPRGKPAKTQTINDPIVFGLDGEFDRRAYEALPQWLKTIVSRSPEYRRATDPSAGSTTAERLDMHLGGGGSEKRPDPDLDDQIPF
jgi:hypothetical protein